MAPAGRAFLKGAQYQPAHEEPSEEYPLLFTTGRTVHHFHTRTKTGRSRRLQASAPDPWVELSREDAAELGVAEGDVVRVTSPRGAIEVPARIGNAVRGTVFAPFHYGRWDPDGAGAEGANALDGGRGQANELTMTVWDPVSKQPYFKTAACRVEKAGRNGASGPGTQSGGA
jgi:anaerobic selenocysteine-containing dehydrogenase